MNKKSKLIKVRLVLDTEIVVENFYNETPEIAAQQAILANLNDIVGQAMETNPAKVVVIKPVKSKDDLPEGWTGKSLPYLPNISFGDRNQDKPISYFLK